jgi:RimJ/RimL family protein N-acetyltransferase
MKVEPVTLMGKFVRLEPLSKAHVPSLAKVGLEPEIWRFMRYGMVETEGQLNAWVQELLNLQAQGTDLPFAVIHQPSGNTIGCTRYLHIEHSNCSLEIGGTWYGLEYQGTLVNTECKYILLKHAFETLECIRVWFKADTRNLRSIHALERIGVIKEGVLRNHMILPGGSIRDSIVYSLLPEEWPQVKQKLEARLSA